MLLDVDPQDEVAFLVNIVGGGDDTVLADRETYPDTCLTTVLAKKVIQGKTTLDLIGCAFSPAMLESLPLVCACHHSF